MRKLINVSTAVLSKSFQPTPKHYEETDAMIAFQKSIDNLFNNTKKEITMEEMTIIDVKVEIKHNYTHVAGNMYRDTLSGKFVKKSVATVERPIYEFTSKIKAAQTTNIEEDEATLHFQENLESVSSEANVYQVGPKPISEVLKMKEGSNIIIEGYPMEMKHFTKTTSEGKKIEIRYFRIQDVNGNSMWVKPGFKVFMKIRPIESNEAEKIMLQGNLVRMPINKGIVNFLTEEEKMAYEDNLISTFSYMTQAKFVKYVPQDVLGSIIDFSNMKEDDFIEAILKEYTTEEIHNAEELDIQKGWKAAMVNIRKEKPWLKRPPIEFVGEGQDGQINKINEAEEVIKAAFGNEILELCQKLANEMTGEVEEIATYKDKMGIWRKSQTEIVNAMEQVEDTVFGEKRTQTRNKAMERLDVHFSFLKLIHNTTPEWKHIVVEGIKKMRNASVIQMKELKAKHWDPKIKMDVKNIEIKDGQGWFYKAVVPVAKVGIDDIADGLASYGIKYLPSPQKGDDINTSKGWLKMGLMNMALMLMTNEMVTLKWSKSAYQLCVEKIEEKVAKIKFYGGVDVAALWSFFRSWHTIKGNQNAQDEGTGHVDQGMGPEGLREEQLDAEAAFLARISWRHSR